MDRPDNIDIRPSRWELPAAQGLYDPRNEKDSCGVGFVCDIEGKCSRSVVERGIEVLNNLLHRGAAGADAGTGDGAGILVQVPHRFYRAACRSIGFSLPQAGRYGVGMVFLPLEAEAQAACRSVVDKTLAREGLRILGWRELAIDADALGESARATRPAVWQCFTDSAGLGEEALERKLYVARRQCEKAVAGELGRQRFYIPSLSCRTVVYKGLMMATQVAAFYEDLNDPLFESALAVVHQRYSTNTFPSWELAQPFRYLAHNGEINTLRGNMNWMRSRERDPSPSSSATTWPSCCR